MVTKAKREDNSPTKVKDIKENSIDKIKENSIDNIMEILKDKIVESLIEKALKQLEDYRIIVVVIMINLEEEMGINQIVSIDTDQVQEIDKTEVCNFKETIKDLSIEIIIIMIEGKIININQKMTLITIKDSKRDNISKSNKIISLK